MALDATVGGSSTNSYVTQDEADTYFEDRSHSSAWESYEEQEQVLITASRMLDWYLKWKGVKATIEQSMQYPRTDVYRPNGTLVDDDIIPTEVKTAVYELALSSLSNDRVEENPLAGIEQVKAGSLMVKADNGDVHSTKKDVIPDHVKKIVSDLISNASIGIVRLMRA